MDHDRGNPDQVIAIARNFDNPAYDFESAVGQLPVEDLPALVNELARVARARLKHYPARAAAAGVETR